MDLLGKMYRVSRNIYSITRSIAPSLSNMRVYFKFKMLGIKAGRVHSNGMPIIRSKSYGSITLGENLIMNNDSKYNVAGINHPCIISTATEDARIIIGDYVGMSGSSIVARSIIQIGSNVNIGANSSIWDNDFHSTDHMRRRRTESSLDEPSTKPIVIEDDVWIGANAIILKGVTIGARSIVAAGSIVTKNVPPDSVVAGNPAKVIKNMTE